MQSFFSFYYFALTFLSISQNPVVHLVFSLQILMVSERDPRLCDCSMIFLYSYWTVFLYAKLNDRIE